MPKRDFKSYVGLSRLGRTNNHYSIESCKGVEKPPAASMLNKVQEFFTNNFIGWFIHDWRVPKAFDYPPIEDSIYPMAVEDEIRIGIAADWATDTVQSKWVGYSIGKKDPHYTIHLGDTYFSGAPDELSNNFGRGKSRVSAFDAGLWPRGQYGSFALCGNHEMFSSGYPYLAMITNPLRGFGERAKNTNHFSGQESPNFCLYNDYWVILGLDTGHQSLNKGILQPDPTNTDLNLPKAVEQWIADKVNTLPGARQRAVIVLTHHQYVTAFSGETEFHNPARQLKNLFPDTRHILWIWGHEHRFSIYGKNHIDTNHIAAFGRCIGNGGMPDEHSNSRHMIEKEAEKRRLVVYDERIADHIPLSSKHNARKEEVGFNGYAMITLWGDKALITYYAAYNNKDENMKGIDDAVFQETWSSLYGELVFNHATDLTQSGSSKSKLKYFGDEVPNRAGR